MDIHMYILYVCNYVCVSVCVYVCMNICMYVHITFSPVFLLITDTLSIPVRSLARSLVGSTTCNIIINHNIW